MQSATKKVVKKAAPVQVEAEAAAPAKRGPGRPRNTESDLPEDVNELLEMLAATEEQGEKRRIRARLRSRGHRGGLSRKKGDGETEGAPAKTTKTVTTKTVQTLKKKSAPRLAEESSDDEE